MKKLLLTIHQQLFGKESELFMGTKRRYCLANQKISIDACATKQGLSESSPNISNWKKKETL